MNSYDCLEFENPVLRGEMEVALIYLTRLILYGFKDVYVFGDRPSNVLCYLLHRHERKVSIPRVDERGATVQFVVHTKFRSREFGIARAHFCGSAQDYAIYAPEPSSRRHANLPLRFGGNKRLWQL